MVKGPIPFCLQTWCQRQSSRCFRFFLSQRSGQDPPPGARNPRVGTLCSWQAAFLLLHRSPWTNHLHFSCFVPSSLPGEEILVLVLPFITDDVGQIHSLSEVAALASCPLQKLGGGVLSMLAHARQRWGRCWPASQELLSSTGWATRLWSSASGLFKERGDVHSLLLAAPISMTDYFGDLILFGFEGRSTIFLPAQVGGGQAFSHLQILLIRRTLGLRFPFSLPSPGLRLASCRRVVGWCWAQLCCLLVVCAGGTGPLENCRYFEYENLAPICPQFGALVANLKAAGCCLVSALYWSSPCSSCVSPSGAGPHLSCSLCDPSAYHSRDIY